MKKMRKARRAYTLLAAAAAGCMILFAGSGLYADENRTEEAAEYVWSTASEAVSGPEEAVFVPDTVPEASEEEEIPGADDPAEEWIEEAAEAGDGGDGGFPAHFAEAFPAKDTNDGLFANPLIPDPSAEGAKDCETDGRWEYVTGEWLEGYTVLFGAAVSYTSSDPDVARVDECGIVEMISPGVTVITASVAEGPYYPAAECSYTLEVYGQPRTDLADCAVSLYKTSYVYGETGELDTPWSEEPVFDAYDWPAVRAYDGGNPLTEGVDYYLEPGENAARAGEASLTVCGIGSYYGTVRLTWIIEKAEPVLAFSEETVVKTTGDKAFTNPLRHVTDGTIRYSSDNPAAAAVDSKGNVTVTGKGTAVITAFASEGINYRAGEASYTVCVDVIAPSVVYGAKVVGQAAWQAEVSDGAEAGTTGRSLIMEAFTIRLLDRQTGKDIDPSILGLTYSGHIQNIGWDSWTTEGGAAGRPGKGLRIEALKIRLTGKLANQYHIYYALHCQNYGWLDWAKDGEEAGTAGMSLRVEAVRIMVLPKTADPPARPGVYTSAFMYSPTIYYRSYVEGEGWQKEVTKGKVSGTSGRSLRLEGLQVRVAGEADLGVEYSSHVQNVGWEKIAASDGGTSGRPGSGKRMEAVKIRLTGKDAGKYDLYYCLHVQNYGWLGWAKNGEPSGSSGISMRVEACAVRILPKGSPRPSNYGKRTEAFVDGIGAAKITLSRTAAKISRNGSIQLTASVLPENRTFKGVTWSSSDPSVASVSGGLVTGRRKGTAVITCTSNDGRVSARCTVTVT